MDNHLQPIESTGSIPWSIVAVAWLWFAAWSTGVVIRRLLRSDGDRGLEQELAFAVVGLQVLALVAICFGSLGCLWRNLTLVPIALPSFFGVSEVFQRLGRNRRGGLSDCSSEREVANYNVGQYGKLLVTVFALFTLGPALNFPTGWDELVYHSVLPRRWREDGWPAFYVDIPYSAFPSLAEILCWMMSPIEALVTSRLLGWSVWLAGCYMLFASVRMIVGWGTALCVAVSLAANQTSLMISQNGYVEAFLLLDVSTMLFMLLSAQRGQLRFANEFGTSVVLGVVAGGAAATKLTGVALVVVPLCFMLSTSQRMGQGRAISERVPPFWHRFNRRGSAMLVLGASAIATAMPFFLRPWWLTGNPCYPYFSDWFMMDEATVECSHFHHAIGSEAFGMRGPIALLASPFLLAWDHALFDGSLGMQWLVLICLAAIGCVYLIPSWTNRYSTSRCHRLQGSRPQNNVEKNKTADSRWGTGLICSAMLLYGFWYCTAQQARFAIPVVAVVAVLAAYGIRDLVPLGQRIARWSLVCATICSLPWTHAGYYLAAWETIGGIWTRTEWVSDSIDTEYFPLVSAIESNTSADAKILMLLEHRSLYIPRRCLIGTPFFQAQGLTPPEKYADITRLFQYLRREQITHLVVANRPLGPDRAAAWWNRLGPMYAVLQQAIDTQQLRTEWASETYTLLAVQQE